MGFVLWFYGSISEKRNMCQVFMVAFHGGKPQVMDSWPRTQLGAMIGINPFGWTQWTTMVVGYCMVLLALPY